jgi:hypothetical protein
VDVKESQLAWSGDNIWCQRVAGEEAACEVLIASRTRFAVTLYVTGKHFIKVVCGTSWEEDATVLESGYMVIYFAPSSSNAIDSFYPPSPGKYTHQQ